MATGTNCCLGCELEVRKQHIYYFIGNKGDQIKKLLVNRSL